MLNPYRPAPGSEPPALAGRDAELSAVSLAMRLTESRGAAQPLIITGRRGMGKTVLLRRAVRDAGPRAIVLSAEGSEHASLAASFRRSLERATADVTSMPERLKTAVRRVVQRLPKTSFALPHDMGAIAFEGHTEPEDLRPFPGAFYDLNAAAAKHERFIVIAIDEIQSVSIADLVPVIEFIHESAGTDQPALLLGAGLPNSRAHLHRLKTYTERWRYFRLDLLTDADARDVIARPARDRSVEIDDRALALLMAECEGYPFFLQEYGSAAWTTVRDGRISYDGAREIVPGVRRLLDESLYQSPFESLTEPELGYAFALARLGVGPQRVSEVAKALGQRVERINWIRNQLIKKEIVYVPVTGLVEFRLPLAERYLERNATMLERRFGVPPTA